MYAIIWQYEIDPAQKVQFEATYGAYGDWYTFFSRSTYYHGSYLHRHDTTPHQYLLIDRWTSREAYHDFLTQHRDVYNQMSELFKAYYLSEQLLGAFIDV